MIRECFIPTGWLTNHRYTPTSGFYLALRAGWGMLVSGLWHSHVWEHLTQTQVWTSSLGDLHVGKEAGAGNV